MQPPPEPQQPQMSLETLEQLTGIPERTIRSYIARGLVPGPRGRGRAASYGDEHLVRLNFVKAVRDAVPYELPLSVLERLVTELPPEQIARIANGQEPVVAAALDGVDTSLLRRRRSDPSALAEAPPPPPRLRFSMCPPKDRAPRDDDSAPEEPDEVEDEVWSTIDVTPRLRISMRGPASATRSQLKSLARRVRAWLSGDDSG